MSKNLNIHITSQYTFRFAYLNPIYTPSPQILGFYALIPSLTNVLSNLQIDLGKSRDYIRIIKLIQNFKKANCQSNAA